MATTTVLVTQLTGQAWVRDADGNLTPLREGMRIPADAQVVTASGSTVQLQADGQPPLTLGENQNVALNPDVFDDIPAAEAAVPAAADPLVENLIAAINEGQDPLAELEPTAATLAGGGGAGSTFVRLSSVVETTSPLALAYPRGTSEVPEDRRGGAASTSDDVSDTVTTPAAPVVLDLVPDAQADTGSITEGVAQPVTGNVLNNDTLGDGTRAEHSTVLTGNGQGTYGTITLNQDGSYSYVLNNGDRAVEALAPNQQVTDTFEYTVTDKNGDPSTASITITITGTNDVPVAAADTGSITEGVAQPVTGNVLNNDTLGDGTRAEHSTVLTGNGQGTYGTITLNPNGGYSYQLDNSNADVKQMALGDTLTDTFTYQVKDKDGSMSTATITITINGQNNDAPQLIVDPNNKGNLQGGDASDVVIGDMGGDTLVPGATANIVLVLDASSSMSMDSSTRLATMKAAVVQALKDLSASGAKDVMVHLVTFGTSSKDLGSFLLTSNSVDNQKALDDAIAAVNSVPAYKNGGAYEYTNYEAGLNTAYDWIKSTSGTGTSAPPLSGASVNKLVFITDGDPTYAQDNNGKGINYFNTSNGEALAMQHVLGTFDATKTSDKTDVDDKVSEVKLITDKGFSIEAVGIDVNSSTVDFLSQLEGATGNGATSVSNGAQLSKVIGQLVGSSGGANAVASDTIHAGAGDDVILGDSIYSTAADKGWADYLEKHPNATAADRLNDIYTNLTTGSQSYAQEGSVGGNDNLYGGAGNDTIFGQAGDDKLYGESGNDKLYGGTGKDLLVGGTGNDVLTGGAGADTFQWSLADLDGGGTVWLILRSPKLRRPHGNTPSILITRLAISAAVPTN
ncbi:MAG: retention module-containing protein [Comamonas sp.]